MNTSLRRALSGAALAALSFLVLPAQAQETPATDAAPSVQDVRDSLEKLRIQYLSLSGVRQTWAIGLRSGDANSARSAAVIFSSMLSGDRYIYRTEALGPSPYSTNFNIAFDGDRYQLFDSATGILSYQSKDSRENPMGVPNPFLLVWDFLSLDDDACDSCRLRLADLADPAVWNPRLDAMKGISADAESGSILVEMPGGVIEGKAFTFRVLFTGGASNLLPAVIERVTPGGVVLTRMKFDDFQAFAGPGGGVVAPTSVVIDDTCDDPVEPTPVDPTPVEPAPIDVDIRLVNFELPGDGALGFDPFSFDFTRASAVWDSDRRIFITVR